MGSFDEVADALYEVPPAEFIAARADAVATARATDRALARRIGELAKPTLAAWAVNTLVRAADDQVRELVDLGGLLRQAQDTLDPEAMRELGRQRQQVVRALAREAARLTRRAGHPISEQVLTQVEETLRAAVADPVAGAAVLAGRLSGALRYSGLGGSSGSTTGSGGTAAARAPSARRPDEESAAGPEPEPPPPVDLQAARAVKAERAARREAEERLRHARATLRTARTVAEEAIAEAEQAGVAVREAERAADQARRGRDDADARVAELAVQLEAARAAAAAAAEDVRAAEESAEQVTRDRDTALSDAEQAAADRDRAQAVVDGLS